MHYRMNVVGHHHPGVQRIALAFKETKRSGDEGRNLRLFQPALAVAGIQVGIHAFGIPVEQLFLFLPGQGAILGDGLLQDSFPLALQPEQDFSWKCAGKPEGDKVAGPLALEVRQRASGVQPGNQPRRLRLWVRPPT
jgi:hypothetical protein